MLDFQNLFILHNWYFVPLDPHLISLPQALDSHLSPAFMSPTSLDSTYKWEHAVFVFSYLASDFKFNSITLTSVLKIHWKEANGGKKKS